jgi:hypothetical protein
VHVPPCAAKRFPAGRKDYDTELSWTRGGRAAHCGAQQLRVKGLTTHSDCSGQEWDGLTTDRLCGLNAQPEDRLLLLTPSHLLPTATLHTGPGQHQIVLIRVRPGRALALSPSRVGSHGAALQVLSGPQTIQEEP